MAILQIDNFIAGLNRRIYGLKQDPNYAWDIYNFDLDQYGRLVKRLGYTRFNSTQIAASTTIDGIFAYFNQSRNRREVLAILSNNDLAVRDDSGASIGSYTSEFTTRRDIQWGVLGSYVIFTLGTRFIRFLYDDTTFGSGTIAAPTFTPTLTATTGGSLDTSSWYRYRFTYTATQSLGGQTLPIAVESSPRSSTKTDQTFDVQLTGSNNAVNIASLAASSSSFVNVTRIYRSNGAATREALDTMETYFLAEQNDATTTYADTIADSSLGGLLDTYDHDRLGTDTLSSTNRLRALAIWNDRIWVFKDVENATACSKRLSQEGYLGLVGQPIPFSFPTENVFYVNRGSGDTLTAATVFRGELVVFFRYSTWVISGGNDPNNPPEIAIRQLFADVGCMAEKSLANSGNYLIWLSHRGVYSFDGSELKFIGDPIQPLLETATQTNYMEAQGIWVDRRNEYWLAMNDGEIGSTQDRIYIYDFFHNYWRTYLVPSTISSLAVMIPQTTAQTPMVLAGSDNESFIYRLLNGTQDTVAGVATEITARWQSHYLPLSVYRGEALLGNRISRKKVKQITINSTLSSDTNLRPRFTNLLESDNGATSNTFTITPNSRTDILSYRISGLHIGRDIRIRTTMDTRSGDATNTDATLNSIAIEFDDSRTY